jgi:copper oxidase (laccase) domain-containing protein
VLEATIQAMQSTHGTAQPSDILVWMEAAIGQDAFEVGREVLDAFVAKDARSVQAFTPLNVPNQYLANIYELARLRLTAMGVAADAIYGGDDCTVLDRDDFFSYRRDAGQTGRMFTAIWRTD